MWPPIPPGEYSGGRGGPSFLPRLPKFNRLCLCDPRNYAIGVQAILPGGNVLIVDKPVVPFIAGKEYSVLAIGLGADSTLDALIIENPFASIPENTARLQFVHAAPATPPVDIYLTPLDGDLAAATPSPRSPTDRPHRRVNW